MKAEIHEYSKNFSMTIGNEVMKKVKNSSRHDLYALQNLKRTALKDIKFFTRISLKEYAIMAKDIIDTNPISA